VSESPLSAVGERGLNDDPEECPPKECPCEGVDVRALGHLKGAVYLPEVRLSSPMRLP
jgi:hypothetical protein